MANTYSPILTKGLEAELSRYTEGKIRFTTDTGRIFLDTSSSTRVEFTDFVKDYTEEEILALDTGILPKIYMSSDTYKLFYYNPSTSEWKTISGSGSGVTSVNNRTGAVYLNRYDVELGNVGNYKAVSTEASQDLTDTEKANARANIGAGTSTFSGSYSDLTNKPTLGTAAAKDVAASGNASSTQVVMGNDTRLSDSRPASDVSSWAKASTKPTYTAAEVGAIATTAKGANGGVAELDSTGKVPSSQLPSFVDDVVEYDSLPNFPTTGESGKIYIAKDTNKTYRWSGSAYAEISPSLALGETSSTAYRGDRGKTAYDHSQSTHARTDATAVAASTTNGNIKINGTETTVYTHPGSGTNPHGTTKSDVGLGNVGNFKAVSTVASQGLTDTEKSNARANIGAGTSSLAIGTTSSTAAAGNHTHTTTIAADSGTSALDMAANTVYKITAGGTTFIFKTPVDTNTTYSSKAAASGGTDVSLVTTGEKYTWNNKSNLTIGTTATTAAAGNHTHSLTIATDTGTNQLTMTANTKYKITAGGASYIFTTPVDNDTTYSSKAAASGGTDVSLVTTGEKYTWNNKTSNTGTVTSVGTGVGLTGGTITTSGTIKAKLRSETALTIDSVAATETANRVYPVVPDKSGYLAVNVPWTDDNTNNAVTQTATTTSANYEVLFSATADNTTRTEGARKNSNLTFNPSTGNLTVTQLNGVTVGSSPKFTDTTYSSQAAASGGTAVSLVTTGEKYTWNNKSNLAIGTTASTAAAGNHTHAVTIAADSGTSALNMAANTTYKLTAGGSTFIFKTPADGNTDTKVTQTADDSTNSNFEVVFSATADNTTRTEATKKSSKLKFNPSTGNLQATQLNGVTIGSAPKFTDNDTKNTAGSTDTSSKIFLIGATSQAANPQTYSDNEVYATSGVLTTKSVQVGGTAATIQYNSTNKCIDFVFA